MAEGHVVSSKPHYSRVLLKLSGEALAPRGSQGIDLDALAEIAQEVKDVQELGVQLAIVIGGGNILRGSESEERGMDRSTADHMGMLATVINALALQQALERIRVPTRVLSAIAVQAVCEPYIRRRAVRHLEKGRIVLFAAGTGNPYFTTDTAAALRAAEMSCDALFKGTSVDGIYTADPKKVADAQRYDTVTFGRVLS